ncbi:Neuropathy target esterase [Thelohanellus kitauei]|uniref:Neuropathy target esterase n=1 Tax=Thelohanellus kitauei TaxID=669202 RepID=A0A0C2J4S7_THEKT|nr:Neuropathy target esterase [Thelohanellus kitauei]
MQHAVYRTLCDSFGLNLDLLIKTREIDFKQLDDQENLFSSPGSKQNDDAIIQSISLIHPQKAPEWEEKDNLEGPDLESKIECAEKLCKIFKEDIRDQLLKEGLFIKFEPGQIIEEGRSNEGRLYFIHKGTALAELKLSNTTQKLHELVYTPGQLCGLFPILSGTRSYYHLIADDHVAVFVISQTLFRKISVKHPSVLQTLALILLGTLSPFLKNLNFGLVWENYDVGNDLYRQGSKSDKIFIIQHGRLRLIFENNLGKKRVLGEFTRNDFVGIEESFERKTRSGTLTAVRATEVVVFCPSLLNFLQMFCPLVMVKIAHFLSKKIRTLSSNQSDPQYPEISSYSTVALVPASSNVPLKNFAHELNSALNLISMDNLESAYPSSNTNPLISRLRYLELITHLEADNFVILWVCDNEFSEWTRQSILHADLILIVGKIDENSSPNQLEIRINQMSDLCAPQHLIILHRENLYKPPDNTASWLCDRGWISEYYHIRCPSQVYRKESNYMQYLNSPNYRSPSTTSDLSRLARRITNTMIGLVLGGGGARGYAQIGAIRALEEAGIPIDMVGGCSIGAFVGGLYATYQDSTYVVRRGSKFAEDAKSIFNYLLDLTLPLISFFTGYSLNIRLISVFKNRQIEDLLIPYFCISTDVSSCQLKVHTCGPIWRACRASMTLLNLLPPICDPKNSHLLIDGGYLNVLPYDVMFRKGARYVVAVDVSRNYDYLLGDYGDELSGWRVLWNRIFPFGKKLIIPSLSEIQENLVFISCIKSLNEAPLTKNMLHLCPPIKGYHVLSFHQYKEIEQLGYEYTEKMIKDLGYTENSCYKVLFNERTSYDVCDLNRCYSESDDDLFKLINRKSKTILENLALPSPTLKPGTPTSDESFRIVEKTEELS